MKSFGIIWKGDTMINNMCKKCLHHNSTCRTAILVIEKLEGDSDDTLVHCSHYISIVMRDHRHKRIIKRQITFN